ncbi:MAG: peptidase [bacterium]
MNQSKWLLFVLSALLFFNCRNDGGDMVDLEIRADVGDLLAKFAPVEIKADISFLPDNEQQALAKLVEASKYMDEIFLRQVWEQNPKYRKALAERSDELGKKAYAYFNISFGPWDRLDEHEAPFIGKMPRPAGAGYYPEDLSKEEFEAYLKERPEAAKELTGLFTLVRRNGEALTAEAYSQAFKEWLEPAAKLMREAADLTGNASLQKYLRSRADAFFSNDYYQSDIDWMDLESPIEITIGPYEIYEDKLFGYKAAFESFLTITDPGESEKLARYKAELPAMERNLPIPNNMKNLDRGSASPIRVVDVVFTAGDTKSGVQTIAYNLPNDERVREEKGSKKVLLRNVIAAKYEKILTQIADRLVKQEQVNYVSADAFTNEVLFHELSHGLGPGNITVDGRETEVRKELKELYSGLEEAKADIMGVYNIYFLIEKGLMPEKLSKEIAVTYLAGLFRGIRFGIGEAHGKGNALQFNYMMEKGAIQYDDQTGTYSVNSDSFKNWVRELVQDICILQANGDYAGVQKLYEKYVHLPEVLSNSLEKLTGIPVDIVPQYTLAEELTNGQN